VGRSAVGRNDDGGVVIMNVEEGVQVCAVYRVLDDRVELVGRARRRSDVCG
jgi:hypothetical protein